MEAVPSLRVNFYEIIYGRITETFSLGSGVRLAAILLRVLGEGVAKALLGPLGAFGVLCVKIKLYCDNELVWMTFSYVSYILCTALLPKLVLI